MVSSPSASAPHDIDPTVSCSARLYDYLLGGTCNYEVDRQLAKQILQALPGLAESARLNRAFLRRAVRFCVESGVRQFLDIGSGVPTVGNVHEVAQGLDPSCRIVYVDLEPAAVAAGQRLLAGNDRAASIQGDARDVDRILGAPETRRLIDFDQPMALLMVSMLHFIPDESDPYAMVRRYREAMAPGSLQVMSHATADGAPKGMRDAASLTKNKLLESATLRSRQQIESLFTGLALVEPGLVWLVEWRPERPEDVGEHPERSNLYAAVGRKP